MRIPIRFLSDPSPSEVSAFLKSSLEKKLTILIIASCRVVYRGRASSTLELGERIIMIKSDGSLQIHRPWDVTPVNWQPPGCLFHVDFINGSLRLRAVRKKPHEMVDIFLERVFLSVSMNLIDEGDFSLYASERDMQKAVRLHPELVESGLKIIDFERHVEPGFIDLYGVDSSGRLVVLELKRRVADKSAILQLSKYVSEVRRRYGFKEVRGILVAPELSKGLQPLLLSLGLEFKRLDPKKCMSILKKNSRNIKITEYFKK